VFYFLKKGKRKFFSLKESNPYLQQIAFNAIFTSKKIYKIKNNPFLVFYSFRCKKKHFASRILIFES
jgi:hypothetical protein